MESLKIKVDLKRKSNETLSLQQGYTYPVEVQVFDNGQEYNCTGAIPQIHFGKSNGKFTIKTEDITIEGNKIRFTLDSKMINISGDGKLQVVMTKDNAIFGSWVIYSNVFENAIQDSSVEDENVIGVLDELKNNITEAKVLADEIKATIEEGGVATKGDIQEINAQLETINTKIELLKKEIDIGCVLRPTTDINNPWMLFEDEAHESKGVTRIEYNSDGTIQLFFDKTYKKIKAFNVYSDEMMKIYGLEVGASVGLNTAKLFLISNLVFGFTVSYSLENGISCNSNFVESCEWVSGVGAKIKFKNIPKQLPNTAQVSTTNSLNLNTTCSITGNREITMKFYKQDGSLVTDITGNWNTMVDVNYRGLVNFNALSVYDENILSSMAIMFSATMKQ